MLFCISWIIHISGPGKVNYVVNRTQWDWHGHSPTMTFGLLIVSDQHLLGYWRRSGTAHPSCGAFFSQKNNHCACMAHLWNKQLFLPDGIQPSPEWCKNWTGNCGELEGREIPGHRGCLRPPVNCGLKHVLVLTVSLHGFLIGHYSVGQWTSWPNAHVQYRFARTS